MHDTYAPPFSPPSPPLHFPSLFRASDGNLCFIPYISEDSKIYILRGRLSAPAGIVRIKLLLLLGNLNLLSLAINLNVQIDIHFKPSCPWCLKRVPDAFRIKVKTFAVSVHRSEMWGKLTGEHRRWPELINSNKTLWIYIGWLETRIMVRLARAQRSFEVLVSNLEVKRAIPFSRVQTLKVELQCSEWQ